MLRRFIVGSKSSLAPMLLGVGLALCVSAQATVLTFDVDATLDNWPLPAGYGDNIDQSTVGGYFYPIGNGFTPNE